MAQPSHTISYHLCTHDRTPPDRTVEVYATEQELAQFAADGFLVRERLFDAQQVGAFKAALDAIVEQELAAGDVTLSRSRRFGGVFVRHLQDKDPVFFNLIRFQPTLSVARAMLGPQVRVLPITGRISYPDQENQETHWHIHQRCIPNPLPPWFSPPQVIDGLIYLDEVNDANGLLCVVPGSHQWIHRELAFDDHEPKPGEVVLRLPAGSCVMIHGNLWHRATPTTPQGSARRLLILPYTAAWMQLPAYGPKPEHGLTDSLRQHGDYEDLELIGDPEGLY